MRRALLAPAAVLLLSGCGPAQEAEKPKTDREQITALVEDLAVAGNAGDAQTICTKILSTQLVNELKAAGGNCVTEMERAIKDANDYDLKVAVVKVTGSTATARVQQGESDNVATFSFVKEKGGWRASALGGGA